MFHFKHSGACDALYFINNSLCIGGHMSDTREQLRDFLASRGETAEQIAHREQDILTLATTSTSSYDTIAYGLMDLLTTEYDDAPALSSVHEAVTVLASMVQIRGVSGQSIGELSDAIKHIVNAYK